jgi:hypothetical protein
MKRPFDSIIVLVVAFSLVLSACKKEDAEPQSVDNTEAETYTGHMVTEYATPTQVTSQTLAVGVEIKATAKANEVTWKIVTFWDDYNDPATATITTNGDTRTLTIPRQKQTYRPGQEATFEGSGTIREKKLTLMIQEENADGTYQHQITAVNK